jgi:hypothetical protein
MRTKVAIVVLALLALAAAPVGLAKGSVTIQSSLVLAFRGLHGQLAPVALTRKDKVRSCQAPASRSRIPLPGSSTAGETERRASTVACEQPPRSAPNVSAGLKAAEAAAILAGG